MEKRDTPQSQWETKRLKNSRGTPARADRTCPYAKLRRARAGKSARLTRHKKTGNRCCLASGEQQWKNVIPHSRKGDQKTYKLKRHESAGGHDLAVRVTAPRPRGQQRKTCPYLNGKPMLFSFRGATTEKRKTSQPQSQFKWSSRTYDSGCICTLREIKGIIRT